MLDRLGRLFRAWMGFFISMGEDPEVMLQDRLKKGRERLDEALEQLHRLCEPVLSPMGELEHIHYFCGNTEIPSDLKERESRRAALYKATVALVRAYANLSDDLAAAGYQTSDIERIHERVKHYTNVREIVRKASGESLDLKAYEADMRHLLDTYVHADEPRKISPFDGIGLLDLIVKTGIADAITSELGGMKGNKDAIAETIENNVRSRILKEQINDPAYFDRMSTLLDEIIRLRREKAIDYEEYLKRIAALAKQVQAGHAEDAPPALDSPGKRALYNNLKVTVSEPDGQRQAEDRASYADPRLHLTIVIDEAIKRVRHDGWRGVQAREQVIKGALYEVLKDVEEVERIFVIVKQQAEY